MITLNILNNKLNNYCLNFIKQILINAFFLFFSQKFIHLYLIFNILEYEFASILAKAKFNLLIEFASILEKAKFNLLITKLNVLKTFCFLLSLYYFLYFNSDFFIFIPYLNFIALIISNRLMNFFLSYLWIFFFFFLLLDINRIYVFLSNGNAENSGI